MPGFQSTRLVTEGALEPFFFLYTDDSIQGNTETCKQSSIMLNYEVKNSISLYSGLSPVWLFTNIVFWPLVGYYLENVFDIKRCSAKMLGFWVLLSMAGIGLSCYMTYYMHGVTGICDENSSQRFHSTFIVLPCIAIYVTVKFFVEHHVFSNVARKIITSIGSCCIGVNDW